LWGFVSMRVMSRLFSCATARSAVVRVLPFECGQLHVKLVMSKGMSAYDVAVKGAERHRIDLPALRCVLVVRE
jgi:hypothetical protein